MSNQQKIYQLEVKRDKIFITAPWSDFLHAEIKSRNGKWIPGNRQWQISKENLNAISNILDNLFGSSIALKVQITINKCKVCKTLELFDKNIIELHQSTNFYKFDSSVESVTGVLPKGWSRVSYMNFPTREPLSYLAGKITSIIDPFILKNITITINNVGTAQLHRLKLNNYSYIKDIKVLDSYEY